MEPISSCGSGDGSVSIPAIPGSSVKVTMFDLLVPCGADFRTKIAATSHYCTWADLALLNLAVALRLRSASDPF
ncbi:MAG: hypothetical protein WBQ27_00310 [Thermoanaerobaculia bacterium]